MASFLKFLKKNKQEQETLAEEAQAEADIPESKPAESAEKKGLFASLRQGLKRTHGGLVEGISRVFLGKKVIDAALLEEIESQLLAADVGVNVTAAVIDNLTKKLKRNELQDFSVLMATIKEQLGAILAPCSKKLEITATTQPFVILLVGVNGSGKTTTIGKLAKQLQQQGKSVMLAAGDTFRAAAIEQLKVWGERNDVSVVAQHSGADSAAVIFDALQSAKAHNIDVLLADTAGRLHTKEHLMEELKKIKRIMRKVEATAPHEVLLVLDATIGQNALNQAIQFNEAMGVTGICLTKLDGTAKGGIIFAIAQKLQIPIRFIGIGEKIDDLRPFVAEDFVEALFE